MTCDKYPGRYTHAGKARWEEDVRFRLFAAFAGMSTGAPVPNPYLAVRDKAFARLESLHKTGVKAPALWT